MATKRRQRSTKRRQKSTKRTQQVPRRVNTPLGLVSVHLVRELKSDEGVRLLGQADYGAMRINLDSEQSKRSRLRIFFHEITHYALEASGLGHSSLLTNKQCEAVCDAVATARVIETLGLKDA